MKRDAGTIIYIAPRLSSWADLKSPEGVPINLDGTEAPGFALVFDSYEACKAEFPNLEPVIVHVLGEPEDAA
jgi:hypothetical protein